MDPKLADLMSRINKLDTSDPELDELASRVAAKSNQLELDEETEKFHRLVAERAKRAGPELETLYAEIRELQPNQKRALLQGIARTRRAKEASRTSRTLQILQAEDYREIDPEIRPLVKELNSRGLTTFGSCSGHRYEQGFIGFSLAQLGKSGIREVTELARKHGLHDLHWTRSLARMKSDVWGAQRIRPEDSIAMHYSLPGESQKDFKNDVIRNFERPLVRISARPKSGTRRVAGRIKPKRTSVSLTY